MNQETSLPLRDQSLEIKTDFMGVDQNSSLFWDLSEQLSQPWSFHNDSLMTGCLVTESELDRRVHQQQNNPGHLSHRTFSRLLAGSFDPGRNAATTRWHCRRPPSIGDNVGFPWKCERGYRFTRDHHKDEPSVENTRYCGKAGFVSIWSIKVEQRVRSWEWETF